MTAGMRQLGVILLLVVLVGCASSGPMFQSMPNRMDGVFLTIRAEKPNNSIAIYEINQAGEMTYAGGVEAQRGETDWSTELTREQREHVLAMIKAFGWLSRQPVSTHEPEGHVYEIRIRRGRQRETYEVHGENAEVAEMLAFLEEISMQRFDAYLDRLPQASQPPR